MRPEDAEGNNTGTVYHLYVRVLCSIHNFIIFERALWSSPQALLHEAYRRIECALHVYGYRPVHGCLLGYINIHVSYRLQKGWELSAPCLGSWIMFEIWVCPLKLKLHMIIQTDSNLWPPRSSILWTDHWFWLINEIIAYIFRDTIDTEFTEKISRLFNTYHFNYCMY